MKIVTAIDSFKGSMTSMEAGLAVTEGIHRVDSDVDVQIRPLAEMRRRTPRMKRRNIFRSLQNMSSSEP